VPWWWNICQWPVAVRRHSEVRLARLPWTAPRATSGRSGRLHDKRASAFSSSGRLVRPQTRCDPLTIGYYLRFLSEDNRPLALDEIMPGLRNADPGFRLAEDGGLNKSDELLAQLEISQLADVSAVVRGPLLGEGHGTQ
jgi:hypothetical protein